MFDRTQLKAYWKRLTDSLKENRTFWIVVVLSGTFAVAWDYKSTASTLSPNSASKKWQDVDTFIPRGYTLVPIEIQNHDSLDSVFGSHGLVDLYMPLPNGKSQIIAQKLKMVRSPNNPDIFAVLVRADEAGPIAGHAGAFFVVLNNRQAAEGGVSDSPRPRKSAFRIIQDGGL